MKKPSRPMLSWQMACALTLISVPTMTLVACAHPMNSSSPAISTTLPAKPTNEFCAIAKPIYWSKSDSDKTLQQVKEHNAVWKKLCAPA